MNRCFKYLSYLCRMPRSRGFGIQSPWTYAFVRYVLMEDSPYYAYTSLAERWPAQGNNLQRYHELCLRIANFVQPNQVVDFGNGDAVFDDYVKHGYSQTCIVHAERNREMGYYVELVSGLAQIDFLRCDYLHGGDMLAEAAMSVSGPTAVFFIDHIRRSKLDYEWWTELCRDDRVCVSLDVYEFGLLIFKQGLNKLHYSVNFR